MTEKIGSHLDHFPLHSCQAWVGFRTEPVLIETGQVRVFKQSVEIALRLRGDHIENSTSLPLYICVLHFPDGGQYILRGQSATWDPRGHVGQTLLIRICPWNLRKLAILGDFERSTTLYCLDTMGADAGPSIVGVQSVFA